MWIELFLCLLLAHLVADFGLQTSASCKSKAEKHWRSIHQYIHAGIVSASCWQECPGYGARCVNGVFLSALMRGGFR